MAVQLTDGTNNNVLDATSKGILVQNPKTLGQEGFVGLSGINDDGTVVAGGRHVRVIAAEGGGLYAANRSLLWDDVFNATTQNTSLYKYAFTTMTAAQATGFLMMNSGAITTLSTSVGLQTFKNFPLFPKSELRVHVMAEVPSGAQSNQTIEMGLFQATLNGAAPGAPTDGIFFRFDPTGNLRGVVNWNGTETQTGTITPPATAAATHDWLIIVNGDVCSFYIDNVLQGTIVMITAAPGQGQPFQAASAPFTLRVYTAGSAPALAPILKVASVCIYELGADLNRPYMHQKAAAGLMGYQGTNGNTMGTTANTLNGAIPAATALTNTAISTGGPVGLGGTCHDLCTLAAGTDGIMNSYQNPASAAGVTGRNLVITGVWIHSIVDAAITGGPLAFVYSLAYGHTAISLATAETGSFVTGTTKAPRRIWLGVEGCPVTSAAGVLLSPQGIYRQFATPIIVAPGEFVALVARQVGTVASAGSVIHTSGFDAHWE